MTEAARRKSEEGQLAPAGFLNPVWAQGKFIMPAFQHILFPVDFSAPCRAFRPLVLAVARQFKARITLLHATQIPPVFCGTVEGSYTVLPDIPQIEQDACRELETFLELPPDSFERVTDTGDPAACITDFAGKNGVDLIMMPTHGYGTFRSLLPGSVMARVLHDAKCAVWTSAHTSDPAALGRFPVKNILCAIDSVPESVDLICCATGLAAEFGAKLRLVHAVVGAVESAQPAMDMEFNQFLLQTGREGVAKLQKQAGTCLEAVIAPGSVASVVRETAADVSADLLVIGRGSIHHTLGSLRTNAFAVIRDSPCPVLSI